MQASNRAVARATADHAKIADIIRIPASIAQAILPGLFQGGTTGGRLPWADRQAR